MTEKTQTLPLFKIKAGEYKFDTVSAMSNNLNLLQNRINLFLRNVHGFKFGLSYDF